MNGSGTDKGEAGFRESDDAELLSHDVEIVPDEPAAATIDCWRCGKPAWTSDAVCNWCHASLAPPAPPNRAARRQRPAAMTMLAFYGLLLGVSVIYGWSIRFGLTEEGVLLGPMLTVEAVDTVLVLVALASLWRAGSVTAPSRRDRWTMWLSAPLFLTLLLSVNVAYHAVLRTFLPQGLPQMPDLLPWGLLAICVQPALVEEAFFRYLALGSLQQRMGMHAAVWVSAIMFGMMHIFAPLSIAVLVLMGGLFGYARVYTGGMALPVLLHFLHNLMVLGLDRLLA